MDQLLLVFSLHFLSKLSLFLNYARCNIIALVIYECPCVLSKYLPQEQKKFNLATAESYSSVHFEELRMLIHFLNLIIRGLTD